MIVKISAIIEAYLQRENRLIIPSVGTLLKRKESGEIVFVEMLKKNDGKLVGLVAEQFAVSAEEAEALLLREREEKKPKRGGRTPKKEAAPTASSFDIGDFFQRAVERSFKKDETDQNG